MKKTEPISLTYAYSLANRLLFSQIKKHLYKDMLAITLKNYDHHFTNLSMMSLAIKCCAPPILRRNFNNARTGRSPGFKIIISYRLPILKTVAFDKKLPITVAGPRWIRTNFPFNDCLCNQPALHYSITIIID